MVKYTMVGTRFKIASNRSTLWDKEIIDNLPVGIYRTTLEGRLVFCNMAFAKIFGFDSVTELIDYPVIELYRNKKDRGALVQTLMDRGKVVDLPLSLKRQDGTPIWCAVTAKAAFDNDGVMVLLDGVMRDVTGEIEQKKICIDFDEQVRHIQGIGQNFLCLCQHNLRLFHNNLYQFS